MADQAERYDSRPDTYAHIAEVRRLLGGVARELIKRADRHDQTKLKSPEVETFDRVSPLLPQLDFGSDEYRQVLHSMDPALRHHYAHNDHHPEHFLSAGINEMNLIQLTEMLCDWIAATRRMKGWTPEIAKERIHGSITANRERFGISAPIERLLRNSLDAILEAENA